MRRETPVGNSPYARSALQHAPVMGGHTARTLPGKSWAAAAMRTARATNQLVIMPLTKAVPKLCSTLCSVYDSALARNCVGRRKQENGDEVRLHGKG